MIKLEHVVLVSPEQMKFIIEGMRNSINSWGKSDSVTCEYGWDCESCRHNNKLCNKFYLGHDDEKLMQKLNRSQMKQNTKVALVLFMWMPKTNCLVK